MHHLYLLRIKHGVFSRKDLSADLFVHLCAPIACVWMLGLSLH